ncbi:hypothetical protein [Phenylobacterium sp.]|jgi:hypothetical protein|uniref:hypothetical protein n=1 Tax=Phenylobacterium sp. TaxID=1871053 RepID=UPI002F94B974
MTTAARAFARLQRLAPDALPPAAAAALLARAERALEDGELFPIRGRGIAWSRLAAECGLDAAVLAGARNRLAPHLAAIQRDLAVPGRAPRLRVRKPRPAPGRRPRPPAPAPLAPAQPGGFSAALAREMRRWNDTPTTLARALAEEGCACAARRIAKWRDGQARPAGEASLAAVAAIERRYGLDPGALAARIVPRQGVPAALYDVSWHLPQDFAQRSEAEQGHILAWVRATFSRQTPYRRYQREASRQRFCVSFPGLDCATPPVRTATGRRRRADASQLFAAEPLASEMRALIEFKSARLSPADRPRRGAWSPSTTQQNLRHLGLFFGALAAPRRPPLNGYGAPLEDLSLALLCSPQVWDAYLAWREARRGCFTKWEVRMLENAAALVHPGFGWLTQNPQLAETLKPIPGLIDEAEVARLQADWPRACADLHRYARMRAGEIGRLARVHRDPFEAILPVLEADSPLSEYLKIGDEILARAPDEHLKPVRHAEAMRTWLMLRLGLHLGFRARNLAELLVCLPGRKPRSEHELADLRAAELRWNASRGTWEVFAPAAAFKNAHSAFFRGAPFQLTLADRGGLYARLHDYLSRQRPRLLAGAPDPGLLFVRHVKSAGDPPGLDRWRFHEAWRRMIERYGVFNPWTGKGALVGVLPHGPHALRAVLATEVLKRTGSFEEAAYAIQDMPSSIVDHYGRFLPGEKAARAARVLDRVWSDAAEERRDQCV